MIVFVNNALGSTHDETDLDVKGIYIYRLHHVPKFSIQTCF